MQVRYIKPKKINLILILLVWPGLFFHVGKPSAHTPPPPEKVFVVGPKVDIEGHKPGTMTSPGVVVSEADEDNPLKLIALVNDNTEISPLDDDIVKLTLKQLQPTCVNKGLLELSVASGGSDIRIFNSGGSTELSDWSVDLNSPSGDLAGLASGDIDLYLEGLNPNSDVTIKLAYKDENNTEVCSDEVHFTIVKVELEPITIEGGTPPDNSCGIGETETSKYTIKVETASLADDKIIWSAYGDVSFNGGNNKGRTVTVKGNTSGDFKLEVDIEGALNPKPYIKGKVLGKKTVDVHVYIVRKDNGTSPAIMEATFDTLLADANKIFEQVAIEFNKSGGVTYIDKTDWLEVEATADNWAEYKQLQAYAKNTGGIEIYCINDIVGANGANWSPDLAGAGITIDNNSNGRTLAHELGHACGLMDIYKSKKNMSLPDDKVKEGCLPDDWSGGSGTGYYNSNLKQKDLIQRLIMYGVGSNTKADFSLDEVYGIDKNGTATLVKVGLANMDRQPIHW